MKLKNADDLPVSSIVDQMLESRPLPMGMAEFREWSDRIISGALVPSAIEDDQRFALASMLMHLGPTESHKPDMYFIHALRKGAINQVAHAYISEVKAAQKAKQEAEAAEKALSEDGKE